MWMWGLGSGVGLVLTARGFWKSGLAHSGGMELGQEGRQGGICVSLVPSKRKYG